MSTTTGHRISEVSAQTGFSASALRFYESHGLVEPARTQAGYRVYDDRTVERLRFIARAKDLRLSLDDIAELLPVWEGADCADVAGQLAGHVADKVAETRTRIAELTAFATELEAAGHRLTHDVTDGPCSDTCSCVPGAPVLDGRIAVAIGSKPAPTTDGLAPIACTLTPGEAVDRVGDWARLLAEQTSQPRRTTDDTTVTIAVTFAPNPELAARAAELAAAEQACCAFIDFTLAIDRSGTTLTATTQLDAAPIIDALLGATP